MASEVVVIPTAHRPEFLALALEKINQSSNPPNDIRIFVDRVSKERLDEVEWVRDFFYPTADIFLAKEHIATPSGTYNILGALKCGWQTSSNLTWLIEEDILVTREFFNYGRAQMATGKYLAVCGRKDRFHYPLYGALYTNPGSLLSRELLAQVVPHINDDYFTKLKDYLDEHFGVWDTQSSLDDGLIRRVVRQMGGRVCYPENPMCAHAGFNFYRVLDIYRNEGTIEQRIQNLRIMLKRIRPSDRYARDFEPFVEPPQDTK